MFDRIKSIFKKYYMRSFYYVIAIRSLFKRRYNPHSNEVLIEALDKIGDFLLLMSGVHGYREAFPGKRLVLMVNSDLAAMVEATGYFDEVIPIAHHVDYSSETFSNALTKQRNTLKALKNRHFDIAIMPSFNRDFDVHAILMSLNAYEKITNDSNLLQVNILAQYLIKRLYTKIIAIDNSNKMLLVLYAEFIRKLGAQDYKAVLPVLPEFNSPFKSKLQSKMGKYAVVVAGASSPWRRWPIERFAEVVLHIWRTYRLPCIILGSERESVLAEEIIKLAPEAEIYNFSGKTSLIDVSAIVRNARIYFGSDTGTLHVAVANKTPAVCIAAGTALTRFVNYIIESDRNGSLLPLVVPFNMNCKCNVSYGVDICHQQLPGTALCVNSIDPKIVIELFDKMYNLTKPSI